MKSADDFTARASRVAMNRRPKSSSYSCEIFPGRGVITTRCVARKSASSTLCVMKKHIFPVRCQTSRISSWIDSRVNASSAPSGSSISRTSGLEASARAMPTRCCMPPESS